MTKGPIKKRITASYRRRKLFRKAITTVRASVRLSTPVRDRYRPSSLHNPLRAKRGNITIKPGHTTVIVPRLEGQFAVNHPREQSRKIKEYADELFDFMHPDDIIAYGYESNDGLYYNALERYIRFFIDLEESFSISDAMVDEAKHYLDVWNEEITSDDPMGDDEAMAELLESYIQQIREIFFI